MNDSWNSWAREILSELEAKSLKREPRVSANDRRTTLFSTNDYLGLSHHPEVIGAANDCWQESGCGPRASALVSGRTEHHVSLEQDIATLKGTEASLLFPTGYAANVGLLSALAGEDLEIFSDQSNHASLIDGCRLAHQQGAKITVYEHLNMVDLETRIRSSKRRRKLVVTDSLFSMTGEIADLGKLVTISQASGATLCVDEAHATLVFGRYGGGIAELQGVSANIQFQTGTLSKAFGLLGGFVATDSISCSLLFNRARTQVFSTALPAPIAAAARVSMRLGGEESPPRRSLNRNLGHLAEILSRPCSVQIVTIGMTSAREALKASAALLAKGFDVPAIRPPTVPKAQCKLRLSISASHSEKEISALGEALSSLQLATSKRGC